MVNPLTFPAPKIPAPFTVPEKGSMNAREHVAEQGRAAGTTSWLTQVTKEVLTHRDMASFHADFTLEDDLGGFCKLRSSVESRDLAQRIRAFGSTPRRTLDLEGFTAEFLNTLPSEITRHIAAAECVILPAHLKSMPSWLSLHCPKVVKVAMYDGAKIDICNRNLRELSLQPGRNLREVRVFQGTTLGTFGISPIDNREPWHLYSETGLQPIDVRICGEDGLAIYKIPYPNRAFIECTPGSDPYEYKSNNGQVKNGEGFKITCRHQADKSSQLLVEWNAGGRMPGLGQLSKNAFGSGNETAKLFDNAMDDRYFSNRAGGANLHLTTRGGVVSFLRNQCLELAEHEMRVYKIRLDGANSGHVTTQGLWSEKTPDGRMFYRSVNFDANSDRPRSVAVVDPRELMKFEFFGDLHLPYTHLEDPVVIIQRDDGYFPKADGRSVESTPSSATGGSDRIATFGANFPTKAQPQLFGRLIECNQSLAPVQNWLAGKDASETCRLFVSWAAAVPNGAVESIQEFGEIIVEQFRAGHLKSSDVVGILRGKDARIFMEGAFTYSKGVRSPAIAADGILAVGHMLEMLVRHGAISTSDAIQVLLGNDWPKGTYAGKQLKVGNYLPAAAAREVLALWCRKNLIRQSEIDEILHDAPADRVAEVRRQTQKA
ncbi:MAG: hypothetical protein V4636_07970 [Pseudomonadota bacterium]